VIKSSKQIQWFKILKNRCVWGTFYGISGKIIFFQFVFNLSVFPLLQQTASFPFPHNIVNSRMIDLLTDSYCTTSPRLSEHMVTWWLSLKWKHRQEYTVLWRTGNLSTNGADSSLAKDSTADEAISLELINLAIFWQQERSEGSGKSGMPCCTGLLRCVSKNFSFNNSK